jgi:hypothetical protein
MLARGQGYVPLLDTNKVWNIHHNWIWEGFTYPYYLEVSESDSTKFILKEEQHSQYIKEVGYLFEDMVTQKVYYIDVNNDEVLLYDFSLVEGDVFEYKEVTKVDSIQLLDGTYRKRIGFRDGYNSWIEGIGSIKGGLLRDTRNYLKNETEAWLLCYYENDSLLYMNDNFDTCNLSFFYNDIETFEKSICPLIYPNPFSQKLSISFDNPVHCEKTEVVLKALDGRVVYNETINSDISIDLSFIGKGIYLLALSNRDFQYTTKIIKL